VADGVIDSIITHATPAKALQVPMLRFNPQLKETIRNEQLSCQEERRF
jgi:hypothetical protein